MITAETRDSDRNANHRKGALMTCRINAMSQASDNGYLDTSSISRNPFYLLQDTVRGLACTDHDNTMLQFHQAAPGNHNR